MVSAKMLFTIDSYLRRAFTTSMAIGGISVLITGDIGQLLPVIATPIWTPLEQNDCSDVRSEKLFYQTLDKVYYLSIIMCQRGETDERRNLKVYYLNMDKIMSFGMILNTLKLSLVVW